MENKVEAILKAVRDLTAAPTIGLPKSKARRIIDELVVSLETPDCKLGLEPHDYQVEDFSPDQADEKCSKCGKRKK